jgi:hypothetical protein
LHFFAVSEWLKGLERPRVRLEDEQFSLGNEFLDFRQQIHDEYFGLLA